LVRTLSRAICPATTRALVLCGVLGMVSAAAITGAYLFRIEELELRGSHLSLPVSTTADADSIAASASRPGIDGSPSISSTSWWARSRSSPRWADLSWADVGVVLVVSVAGDIVVNQVAYRLAYTRD